MKKNIADDELDLFGNIEPVKEVASVVEESATEEPEEPEEPVPRYGVRYRGNFLLPGFARLRPRRAADLGNWVWHG